MELLLMVKVNASFRIEEPVLKEIKRIAFNEETTQTAIINDFLKEGLKAKGVNIEELLAE